MSQEALVKKEDEHRATSALLERHKREAREQQQAVVQANLQVKVLRESEMRWTESAAKASAAAATQKQDLRLLTQERDALLRKISRAGEGAPPGGNVELEYYRSVVKCTLCKRNEKNAIITKCCHAFCRECIDQRLNLRNRKCPACAVQFDFQSVKELFLTS